MRIKTSFAQPRGQLQNGMLEVMVQSKHVRPMLPKMRILSESTMDRAFSGYQPIFSSIFTANESILASIFFDFAFQYSMGVLRFSITPYFLQFVMTDLAVELLILSSLEALQIVKFWFNTRSMSCSFFYKKQMVPQWQSQYKWLSGAQFHGILPIPSVLNFYIFNKSIINSKLVFEILASVVVLILQIRLIGGLLLTFDGFFSFRYPASILRTDSFLFYMQFGKNNYHCKQERCKHLTHRRT